jgi:hypothetical protein
MHSPLEYFPTRETLLVLLVLSSVNRPTIAPEFVHVHGNIGKSALDSVGYTFGSAPYMPDLQYTGYTVDAENWKCSYTNAFG